MSDARQEYVSVRFASSLIEGTPVIVEIGGELDHYTAPMIEDSLAAACRPTMDLVVDVNGLQFCDCAGLSALLRTGRRCTDVDARLRLAAAQPTVMRLLSLAGTPEIIPVYPTVGAAVKAARAESRAGAAHTQADTRADNRVLRGRV